MHVAYSDFQCLQGVNVSIMDWDTNSSMHIKQIKIQSTGD